MQSLATPAFAGTAEKECVVVDYYLTTIAEKINMCPWRSWIARVTPTHKVAGSNPVGHTIEIPTPTGMGISQSVEKAALPLLIDMHETIVAERW